MKKENRFEHYIYKGSDSMQKPNMLEAKKRTTNEAYIVKDAYRIPTSFKGIGEGKTYHIKTYGCQMNMRDSETINAILEDMGFTKEEEYEKANLVLLNTCAIRENAHDKVFGMLGRLKYLKSVRPDLMIGLCGCMAQEEVVVDQIISKYQWLDFVFGTHNIHNLPTILANAINHKKIEVEVFSKEGDIVEGIPVKRDHKYKAWVNIIYGCDKFCTYCIVPYTRGKQRSRNPEDILREVEELVKVGYQEVTLLGQNVNAYGKDMKNKEHTMAKLLELVAHTSIPRIRFVTSHPWDFTDDMIKVIKKYDNIMPYIHLPIQSGSNNILKTMGRKYTKEDYLTLFNKIKKEIPNVAITTDIIVGFPGETDDDFQQTMDVVHKCQFDGAFTFIYSKRAGTPAAKMEDHVSLLIKKERLQQLNQAINHYSLLNNQKLVHKTVSVLIEGVSDKNDKQLMGYTDTMKLVNVTGDASRMGQIVPVTITSAKSWSLNGEINER